VEAVAVEAMAVEAVAAEAVAVEAVAAEAVAAEAVAVEADLEILKEITQVMAVEATSLTAVKHVVKVINLLTNQSKATKVAGPKVAVIIEAEAIVDNAVTEIDYSSSSTFFCLMGENIPLSSMISLAPGRIERISSVISPVFL
jgi:hypothetical protein